MNVLLAETCLPSGAALQLVQGDLTSEKTDAIVNAANSSLHHGGGLAWAIVQKGGEIIQRESDDWVRTHGPVRHDKPAWTSGGALPCRFVIHAVGPVWGEGDEEAKLAAAVRGSLRVADQLNLASLALPAISTGIFGFPKDRAAPVILTAIREYFTEKINSGIRLVRLVLYDQATITSFSKAWDDHFGAKPQT